MREVQLPHILGDSKRQPPVAKLGKPEETVGVSSTTVELTCEPGVILPTVIRHKQGSGPVRRPAFLFLHIDGKAEAMTHPLAAALVERGAAVVAPDLRATGTTKPPGDAIAGAPDHNSAEHALWVGRPLLGQWVFDVRSVLDWLAARPDYDSRRLAIVGIGQAGIIALCAAAIDPRLSAVATLDTPTTLITETAYAPGTHMGLLAPGLLTVADVPHLAALVAPRPLVVARTTNASDGKRAGQLQEALAFTRKIYLLENAAEGLHLLDSATIQGVAEKLMASR
jgi:hypothetical protein